MCACAPQLKMHKRHTVQKKTTFPLFVGCSIVNESQIGSPNWSWHIRPHSGLQTLVRCSKEMREKAKRWETVSHCAPVGWWGMASTDRPHPAAPMQGAGQERWGALGTAWSPGHQASPWLMKQVWGQAAKYFHGSGPVYASVGSTARHGHGCDAATTLIEVQRARV